MSTTAPSASSASETVVRDTPRRYAVAMTDDRIGVCSWSLKPAGCDDLVDRLRACGMDRVQLALDPLATDYWDGCGTNLTSAGISLVSGMVGAVGEDYSTIDAIRRTGGVVPDATWPATRDRMRQAAVFAGDLGLPLVTFHAGFIPDDADEPAFAKAVARVREVADLFPCPVALETGQESAQALSRFLDAVDRREVGVNFDPANMLLYGSGDPIDALRRLLPRVVQVHVKDATPSGVEGEWGREVPVGEGAVPWAEFVGVLRDGGYGGDLVIEREAGPTREADVRSAADLIRGHLAGHH